MKSGLRIIKKIFRIAVIAITVLFISIAISVFLYKDNIIQLFIREVNKNLSTPVSVGKIDMNVWDRFPQVAVRFDEIAITESTPGSSSSLLTGEKLFVVLNPFQLIQGDIEINQIHLENAEVFLRISSDGTNNFQILKESGGGEDSLVVDLSRILLRDVKVNYVDDRSRQTHRYQTDELQASLNVIDRRYIINGQGDVLVEYLRIRGRNLVENKEFLVQTNLEYEDDLKELMIKPSLLELEGSKFEVTGNVETSRERNLQLNIDGVETNIRTLVSILPGEWTREAREYQSSGDVYFNMALIGSIDGKIAVSSDFGLRDANLTHPGTGLEINRLSLSGQLITPSINDPKAGTLTIQNISGTMSGNQLSADMTLMNFEDPSLDLNLSGTVRLADLLKFREIKNIEEGYGELSGQLSFSGKIKDLDSRYTFQKLDITGEMDLEGAGISISGPIKNRIVLDGSSTFNKSDIIIKDLDVNTSESRFRVNGIFKNLVPFLFLENQVLNVSASLDNAEIILDEFIQTDSTADGPAANYILPQNIIVNLKCDINKLDFRRFKSRALKGDIKITDQRLFVQKMEFNAMGGHLMFDGLINTKNDILQITNSAHLENIAIDSVFYVFNNFNQSWLIDDNLKGQVFADVLTDMTFSPALKFYDNSLEADISIRIKDGELNNFQPLMQLEKYVNDEDLSHLKFSEITNDISIENRTIYLPGMDVRSNVTDISISGTHSFDRQIDYRVVVPVKTISGNQDDDAFGAVEQEGGVSKLHLKIIGTTDNYNIVYDTRAVGNKIVSDIKKEVEELKDVFRKKEEEQEDVLLNEDEFFEWDEEPDTTSINRFIPRWPR